MTFNNRPQMRELPLNVPTHATVKIYPDTFYDARRGIHKEQWVATYRPDGARDLRDLVKVVVNFYMEDDPQKGDLWEVRMLHRAPKTEIVFANAVRLVESAQSQKTELSALRERDIQESAANVVESETVTTVEDQHHQQAKRTICAWMAMLPRKLNELATHFNRR